MPVNHEKEFLKSVHAGVVFLQFLAIASNGHHTANVYISTTIVICVLVPFALQLLRLRMNVYN